MVVDLNQREIFSYFPKDYVKCFPIEWYCKILDKNIRVTGNLPSRFGWICHCGFWFDGVYDYNKDPIESEKGFLVYNKCKSVNHFVSVWGYYNCKDGGLKIAQP